MILSISHPAREPALTGGFDQLLRWGVDPATGQAFWMRQQTCGRLVGHAQTMEVTLACFQRQAHKAALVQDSEPLPGLLRKAWRRRGEWEQLRYNWHSGSFLSSEEALVRGRMFTDQGAAHYTVAMTPLDRSCDLSWPLGSVSQQDADWQGDAVVAGLPVSGSFQGGQWQFWGRLVSPGLAMVHARHFEGRPEVSFFGMGQTLAPRWQSREPLSLSLGQLRIGEEVIRFDRWWPAPTVDAPRLDNYRWIATLANADYRLQVMVDGGNTRLAPWLALNETLPGGGRRVLKISPYATVRLRLYRRGSQDVLDELRSGNCLLMTAIPGNQVSSPGPLSVA